MKRNQLFLFLFFFITFIFTFNIIIIAGTPNLSAFFNSNGDLINNWYWLRDSSLQHYAQYIFEKIPSGDYDLALDITALATDRTNGNKGFPAEFYLIYETLGHNALVRQKVTLPNVSASNDPVGYTCHGQIVIPGEMIQDSTVLFVRIERISPENNHIAFNDESIALMRASEAEDQIIVQEEYSADKFNSNGSLINSWYWLRDPTLNHFAEWTFENIPSGDTDLLLNVTVLATDGLNGGRGFDARFLLIYGFPGTDRMGGVFKTKEIYLPNISPASDPVGYTCQGIVTIPRDFIAGATTFFFRVERLYPNDNHIAFNQDSIVLLTE